MSQDFNPKSNCNCQKKKKTFHTLIIFAAKDNNENKITHPRSIFFIHNRSKKIENLIESSRAIDPMKSLHSSRRRILCDCHHLLNKHRIVLKKMLKCNATQIQHANMSSNHEIIIFVEENVEHHCGDFHCVLNCVKIWIENARSNKHHAW